MVREHTSRITLAIAATALTLAAGCGKNKGRFPNGSKTAAAQNSIDGTGEISVDSTSATTDDDGSSKTETAPVAETPPNVGIRNYLQINATFSTLTGVPTTNDVVAGAFANVKTQLPSGNNIKTFSPSVQVGISKLAAAYCDAALKDATLRPAILPGFDYEEPVASALDAAGQGKLIDNLMGSFWGSAATSGIDQKVGRTNLTALLATLKVGLEAEDATQTHNISVGMCAAVLGSSAVTFIN
jgi:hypothetical protein